jgi:hypothetical protein
MEGRRLTFILRYIVMACLYKDSNESTSSIKVGNRMTTWQTISCFSMIGFLANNFRRTLFIQNPITERRYVSDNDRFLDK